MKKLSTLFLALSFLIATPARAEIKYKNYKTAWACFKLIFGSLVTTNAASCAPIGVLQLATAQPLGVATIGISYPFTVAGAMIARSGFKDLSRLCAQEMKEEDEFEKYQQQQGYLTNR